MRRRLQLRTRGVIIRPRFAIEYQKRLWIIPRSIFVSNCSLAHLFTLRTVAHSAQNPHNRHSWTKSSSATTAVPSASQEVQTASTHNAYNALQEVRLPFPNPNPQNVPNATSPNQTLTYFCRLFLTTTPTVSIQALSTSVQGLTTTVPVPRSQVLLRLYGRETDSNQSEEAVIEEECPKCKHPRLSFRTAQLRGVDEGQTIFYTCLNERCGHKFTANS